MNNPQGFTYANGQISNINPIAAMFNPATATETNHSIVSYYLASALFFAGCYGIFYLKNKSDEKMKTYYRKLIVFTMSIAAIFAVLIGITGDSSAKYLAHDERLKFAAMEGLAKTQAQAPLQIGGYLQHNQLQKSINLPGLLSFLAYGAKNTIVQGLDAFNPALWPPLWIHFMFDAMVGIGGFLTGIIFLFFILYKFKREISFSKLMIWGIFLSAISAVVAVECGWVLTEVGRQPYAIYGILTTQQAFTTSNKVLEFAYIFPTLYLALFVLTGWILRRHYRHHPLQLP